MSKQAITITLLSRQEDGGEAMMTSQVHTGHLYKRPAGTTLIYVEEGTTTTVMLDAQEIRLYRRGVIESWQVFQNATETPGHLTLGLNGLPLRVVTSAYDVSQGTEGGHIKLAYQLFSDDAETAPQGLEEICLGQFSLSLSWIVSGPEELF
jgi:uncharacterized beta-barrel protein YwiB (DUF1934 family)